MSSLKKFLPKNVFGYFGFFYSYLGNSVFLALCGSMMVAVLDGVGLTMFLPLLQVAGDGDSVGKTTEASDMAMILDVLQNIGIPLTLINVLVLMLVFFLLKGVAKFLTDFYRVVLQQRFANKLRLDNMKLLAGYDYRAFSRADSGRIQNTFSGEVERLNQAYRQYFLMLQQGIMTLVYVLLAYSSNPKFAMIVAVGGLGSNLAFKRIYAVTKEASKAITSKTHRFQGYLIQSVTSFKFLKATNLINAYRKQIDQAVISVEKEQRRVGTMNALAGGMREPLIIVIVVIAIYIQIFIFEESMGLIILSLLFFYRGLTSLVAMQNYYNMFLGTSGSITNMEEFVRELEGDQEMNGDLPIHALVSGIQAKSLSYGYDNHLILKDLSLSIRKNETIGIVGESGSGKTTLANILCGLLRPEPGMVFVDGKDITDLDLPTFRNRIGYVTQEAQVFSDSIYNNISFWAPRTPENEKSVRKALQLAHAERFVMELPQGMDTVIGINGVNLSGGQRQRLSIARELYRDVDILVLDEATSALDSQSERSIQENIESLSGSYTMIVIAHRLSTIQNADRIVFLKPGGDFEIGDFTSLTRTSQLFQSMVALQSMG